MTSDKDSIVFQPAREHEQQAPIRKTNPSPVAPAPAPQSLIDLREKVDELLKAGNIEW